MLNKMNPSKITSWGTMFDGGDGDDDPENDPDDPLAGDDDNDDDGDDNDDPEVQKISMFGNEYSLDEVGVKKMQEQANDFQTSYHTNQKELLDMKRQAESGTKVDEGKDDNDFPFDSEDMSDEDKKAAQALQTYIKNEIQTGVEKSLEPFADKELTRDIQAELKEVETQYGEFNQDELLTYAKKNGLVTNLVAAYRDMTYDKQIEKGRKLEAIDQQRKKRGILSSGKDKDGKKKSIKYDPNKHRDMSYTELLEQELL